VIGRYSAGIKLSWTKGRILRMYTPASSCWNGFVREVGSDEPAFELRRVIGGQGNNLRGQGTKNVLLICRNVAEIQREEYEKDDESLESERDK
jgi:hypothetical protein